LHFMISGRREEVIITFTFLNSTFQICSNVMMLVFISTEYLVPSNSLSRNRIRNTQIFQFDSSICFNSLSPSEVLQGCVIEDIWTIIFRSRFIFLIILLFFQSHLCFGHCLLLPLLWCFVLFWFSSR